MVARWADVDREPFNSAEVLDAYLAETAGTLMWASAQALGAQYIREPAVRAVGKAAGLAVDAGGRTRAGAAGLAGAAANRARPG